MREYTGDRVFQALRAGYASLAGASGLPVEPPLNEYQTGAVPLQTLPAPYWNWFFSAISNNDPRVADVFQDLYDNIDYIMAQAGQAYNEAADDLFTALYNLWNIDITTEKDRAIGIEEGLRDDITALQTDSTDLEDRIEDIEDLIPTQTTDQNQLADKAFVNSSITNMASRYITYDASGSAFPTRAALLGATTVYNQGAAVTPTTNDYAVVTADEGNNGEQWRWLFDGTQWDAQYRINDAPFTSAQTQALNSGITSALVSTLQGLPDANTIVLTSGNQNIAGTKIFSTSPGVPAKNTPIANGSGGTTAIATEAQISAIRSNALAITGTWTCPTPALPS